MRFLAERPSLPELACLCGLCSIILKKATLSASAEADKVKSRLTMRIIENLKSKSFMSASESAMSDLKVVLSVYEIFMSGYKFL